MEAVLDMAKVTTKGQITIPVAIRKALGIKTGDKVLFIDGGEGVITMRNATLEAFSETRQAFEGAAQEAGLETEDDVVDLVKSIRRERASR
ncbi:MAG: AbrB/MazE/SpoVT family DNA-binding domain-containing protein [Eggerthellaceae bacterium]|nr:AbrB/MazE/SpoVT family DNA-binding domain-containing protein [Eggerthellaceae bacterium]